MAPGDEEVATLTLVNSGSLPAKFQGFITIANEAAGSEEGYRYDTLMSPRLTGIEMSRANPDTHSHLIPSVGPEPTALVLKMVLALTKTRPFVRVRI